MYDGNVFLLNDDNIGKRLELELEKIKKYIWILFIMLYFVYSIKIIFEKSLNIRYLWECVESMSNEN